MKIFWSYARLDDQPPSEKVTNLRQAFEIVLSQVIGKKCEIYFDKLSFRWGVEWRKEIERLITESNYFVCIVTPSYFNSRMCIFELQKALAEDKRILPIYFRTYKIFKSSFKEDGLEAEINKGLNEASRKVRDLQMKDFRKLRTRKLDSGEVEDFLDSLAEEIA